MGNPPDSERSASEHPGGPGQRLAKAREARQLTVDAVAAQLRVETKIIAALERDDYEHLPSAVFVRGYLRAYARAVGLPAEPLIEAFDRRTTQAPPPLVLPTAIGPDIEPRRGRGRWLLLLALAVLALVAFYQWWRGGERTAAPPAPQHAANAPLAPPPAVIAKPAATTPAPVTNTAAVAEPTPSVPVMAPGVPLENLYETPRDESTASAPATTGLGKPTNGSAARVTPAPAAAPPPTTGNAGDLVLRFKADSWVDVRDAAGKTLLHGVARAGSRQVLQGRPPLHLTLGNSPAVEVEYRGQRFDQSRYNAPTRVARFTVGSQ